MLKNIFPRSKLLISYHPDLLLPKFFGKTRTFKNQFFCLNLSMFSYDGISVAQHSVYYVHQPPACARDFFSAKHIQPYTKFKTVPSSASGIFV